MSCEEMVYSNDFAELIFEYNVRMEEFFGKETEDYCVKRINAQFAVAYLRRSVFALDVKDVGYSAIPKLYAPMDLTAPEEVGAVWAQNQMNLQLTGRNVLIAFIDTGIDLNHPVFLDRNGKTRVIELWDQTDLSGTAPEGIGYGSVYNQKQIDERLAEYREDPSVPLPGKDESDHGTFLAGVAAGSRDAAAAFIGAAPEASIVVVKLKPAKSYLKDLFFVRQEAEAYQEDDIMMALRYVKEVQYRKYRPMVVCLGMGTNMGGHTGSSTLSRVLNTALRERGIAAVIPTGNEANMSHHFQGAVNAATGREAVEIRVPEGSGGFTLELWADVPERYQVGIRSPGGEEVPSNMAGRKSSNVYEFVLENTRVLVDYRLTGNDAGGQLILMRFDRPSAGIWTIEVQGRAVIWGGYHMWLPVREFVEEGTVFLRPNPNITLTDPSATESAITMAGYDHITGGIYVDSGRGFTRTSQIKPDLAAPAVNVYGPTAGGGYTQKSGTSIAAALTAGVCANLMEWAIIKGRDPYIDSTRIKEYLIRGARRESGLSYPSREWGYGKLDLEGVFRAFQG